MIVSKNHRKLMVMSYLIMGTFMQHKVYCLGTITETELFPNSKRQKQDCYWI